MARTLSDDALQFFREQGRRGGKLAAENMTPEERVARAKKASLKAAEARQKKTATAGRKRTK